jgi:Holliday junction resolvase RusA-like endonuclease
MNPNPIFFVSNQRPRSINADSVEKFKKRLANEFEAFKDLYDGLPLSGSLYSKIIYIYRGRKTDIDVDNMSKPVVDAFKSVIYSDDDIINHRVCSKIERNALDIDEIEFTQFPSPIAEKLDSSFSNDTEDILFFEVGPFSKNMIKFVGV